MTGTNVCDDEFVCVFVNFNESAGTVFDLDNHPKSTVREARLRHELAEWDSIMKCVRIVDYISDPIEQKIFTVAWRESNDEPGLCTTESYVNQSKGICLLKKLTITLDRIENDRVALAPLCTMNSVLTVTRLPPALRKSDRMSARCARNGVRTRISLGFVCSTNLTTSSWTNTADLYESDHDTYEAKSHSLQWFADIHAYDRSAE